MCAAELERSNERVCVNACVHVHVVAGFGFCLRLYDMVSAEMAAVTAAVEGVPCRSEIGRCGPACGSDHLCWRCRFSSARCLHKMLVYTWDVAPDAGVFVLGAACSSCSGGFKIQSSRALVDAKHYLMSSRSSSRDTAGECCGLLEADLTHDQAGMSRGRGALCVYHLPPLASSMPWGLQPSRGFHLSMALGCCLGPRLPVYVV